MANIIQKTIYNLSSVSPVLFMTAVVWVIQIRSFIIPGLIVAFCILINIIFGISFAYGKRHIASIEIRVNSVAPHDGWVVGYFLSYILPFTNLVLKDNNPIILGGVITIMFIISAFIISNPPNPLLTIKHYHYYKVSTENGVSDYLMISKRKIRNKKDIRSVYRLFEFLLIDEEV